MRKVLPLALLLSLCLSAPQVEACLRERWSLNAMKDIAEHFDFRSWEPASGMELQHHETEEGPLAGVRLISAKERPEGYLLVLQGNAMLFQAIVDHFIPFTQDGFDVYLFNYRGFDGSAGKPSIASAVADVESIIARLEASYPSGFNVVYGISSGGVVAANALAVRAKPSLLILDATPDKVPFLMACGSGWDPERHREHLRAESGLSLAVIGNGLDEVVNVKRMDTLRTVAKEQGVDCLWSDLGHPLATPADAEVRIPRIRRLVASARSGQQVEGLCDD